MPTGGECPIPSPLCPRRRWWRWPPANWSAPAGVSTMTGGPTVHQVAGGWVGLLQAPRTPPRGGSASWRPSSPRPVRSLHPHLVRTAGRPGSLRRGRRPQRGGAHTGASGPDLEERRQRQASQYLGAIPQPRPQVRHRQARAPHQRRPGPGLVALTAAAGRSRSSARVPPRKGSPRSSLVHPTRGPTCSGGSGGARHLFDQDAPSVLPLDDPDLMAGLHAGERIYTEPAKEGGGIKVR